MVGRSPSTQNLSPYNRPPILAETTTTRTEIVTTTTTTTTTTHFFPFPLWKKRSPVSNSSSLQSTLYVQSGPDEHGLLSSSARSSFSLVEKDLPPIPGDQTTPQSRGSNAPLRSVSPAARSIPSRRSTSALAQASLEVGLSPILPRTSSSSSSSNEIIPFTSSPSSLRPLGTRPRLRKSKSAQKLGATMSLDPAAYNEYRRSRGISFSGSTLLSIGKNVRNPERQEHSTSSCHPASNKGLASKSSFWSRRRRQLQDSPVDLSSPALQSTQLPELPPILPLNMNITITSPSKTTVVKQKGVHIRGLSRSHSAHSHLRLIQSDMEGGPSLVRHQTPPESTPSHSVPSLPLSKQSVKPVREPIVSEENAPKRRLRAQTNPPLLNRLSLGWFPSSSPSLPRLSSHPPVFTRSHTSSSAHLSASMGRQRGFLPSAESSSSRPSSGLSVDKEASVTIPLPADNEEPYQYLRRLRATVTKAEVAGILASSSEAFYSQALQAYIERFDFVEDPLDVALRKLLMDVGLPRETQQIDRVIEAFAKRYLQCNPTLFSSDDHPYILAFSLIMLHTDAFNKSNKRKMSKTDYIKNTQLPGIFPEVLTCFYDNIVFAPFIFIEDSSDFNSQRGITHEGSSQSIVTSPNQIAPPPTPILKANKIDPYYHIVNNLLGPFRIDVDSSIPRENPYSYEGTAGPWDETQLQRSFAMADKVEVSIADAGRTSPFFSKATIAGLAGSSGSSGIGTPAAAPVLAGEIWSLKLTKVGLLNRKDDVLEGGRKASSRKWRYWSVVLTESQLLFFRDLSWANFSVSSSPEKQTLHPQPGFLRPDELLTVRGAIAVYDKSYTRNENTFRFLLSDGRQLLLQASTEKELNEWIARINYASAFKTAGVRIRPLEMSKTDVQLTGVAAATSHLHDLQTRSIKPHIWNDDTPCDLMRMLSNDTGLVDSRSIPNGKLMVTNTKGVDLEVPTAPEIDGAEQFKATFDQVKADLAAGFMSSNGPQMSPVDATRSDFFSPLGAPLRSGTARLPSRTSTIQSKIDDLDSRIVAAQAQLDTNLRLARNIATLTPFQKSTRDQLLVAVQDLAQRVVQVRLEISRFCCHREVLANDIASEWHSWRRANTIALQAATETLQNRQGKARRMTLSQPASDPINVHVVPESDFSHPFDSSPSRKSQSSLCESFYSAMDFGPDWPLSEEASSKFLDTSHLFDSPLPSASSSVHSHTVYDGNLESSRNTPALPASSFSQTGSPYPSMDSPSHEIIHTAPEAPEEEAEDWSQTRCAQRVSLVRLPSDIQLKPRFCAT